ncbi:hypothetical protein BVRB_3g070020 [Beta vulgaris subsp. vulgaris]|nr:hypothetical protein BVRB_3g070020 [Beta vulgaris subsp. vulgaris]
MSRGYGSNFLKSLPLSWRASGLTAYGTSSWSSKLGWISGIGPEIFVVFKSFCSTNFLDFLCLGELHFGSGWSSEIGPEIFVVFKSSLSTSSPDFLFYGEL